MKLALPLLAGIIIGWLCNIEVLHIATLFVVSVSLLAIGLFSVAPRWLFGVGAVGMMLVAGLFAVTCDKKLSRPEWPDEKGAYVAQLLEVPYMGGGATRALARVARVDTLSSATARCEGVVYIYFANSVESEALCVGDMVGFEGVVKNPSNAGNPAEFDAVRYMRVKGIDGSVFLPVDGWKFMGEGEKDISMLALELRDKVVRMYEHLGFKGDELYLLSAFTVGEKRGFSQSLKDAYASAGMSHILALSGLHLGVFYMMLVALFSFFGGRRSFYLVRELLAILLLWGFVFVAGFTSSVLRAAVLFTIVGVGRCLRRDATGLNSLAFAAIAMLLFSPRLLFDVGFQLSFASVAAILLFLPWLRNLFCCDSHGKVYDTFFSLVAVSLAAQVGVLPFVWYYFGTFPLYFLLANLLLVPLAPLLMGLAVALWVTAFVPLVQVPIAWLLSVLLSFMNGVVGFVAGLPAASFMLPQIGVAGALFVALLFYLFFFAVATKRWWLCLLVSVVSVFAVLLNFFTKSSDEVADYLLLFNNRKMAAVLAVRDDGNSYLLSSVPQFDAEVDDVVQPFVRRERLVAPVWAEEGYCDNMLRREAGLVTFGGLRLQMLADDCWRNDSVQSPMDALLLCRGFLGPVDELLDRFPASCILLDGSLYEGSRRRLLRECKKAGVGCVDISQKGAVRLESRGEQFALIFMRGK